MTYKEQIVKVLTHPLFIGIVLTSIILTLISPDISKYKVEIVEKLPIKRPNQLYFSDLNNDGNSEEINIDNNPTLLKVMLFDGVQFINQYNLRSTRIQNQCLYTGDFNNDDYKEIYLLTYRGDSILLSIIDPVVENEFLLYERLIFYCDTIKFELDNPQANYVGLVDFRDGKGKTLIFSICTGFSKQPRNVFRYDIYNDDLMVSPLSEVSLNEPILCDLNADSVPEILYNTAATGNYHTSIPFSDHSAWLMALNKDLQFVFEPIEFQGYPSSLMITPISSDNSMHIAVLHNYYGKDTISPGLYIFNNKGELLEFRKITINNRRDYYLTSDGGGNKSKLYLLGVNGNLMSELNEELAVINTKSFPPLNSGTPMAKQDVDFDGSLEYILLGKEQGSLVICRHDLSHPYIVDFDETGYPAYSTALVRNGRVLFYFQFKDAGYITSYGKNPLYYLRFPLIALFYVLVSLLVYLIYRIQKYRANMRYQTQKKISELQILSLKNQIDPHFTFNILNSIGSLYSKGGDKADAYNIFVKYSKLLRHSIQKSDKISVSLEEELHFVRNYIELEQFRNDNSFHYKITSDENVDISRKIPRMLIHSFVENSIKHGIRQLPDRGQLSIDIYYAEKANFISIKDNGPGLQKPPVEKIHSTGKGLMIIDELISLFNQLEGTHISYSLTDINSKDSVLQGTEALIKIPD